MVQAIEIRQPSKSSQRILASAQDLRSFFVPSYGFDTRSQAEAYQSSLEYARENRIFDGSDAFAQISLGRAHYVARMNANFGSWLTTELVGGERSFRPSKPIYQVLRPFHKPRAVGAYNVALLVEGPREHFHHVHRTNKHPKWWYRLASGPRACYAVWERDAMTDMGNKLFVGAARSGRGVIYARETQFDHAGEPKGSIVEVVRLEFSIMDRDSGKDDLSRVQVFSSKSFDETLRIDPNLDQSWKTLIERAEAGFDDCCQPIPAQDEAWRRFFVDQWQKSEADDKRGYGQRFSERIEQIGWRAALDLVEEAWQLEVVVNRYGQADEFSDSGGMYCVPHQTVPEMLRRYACSDERRKQLFKMIADFVAPRNNLWDYCGD